MANNIVAIEKFRFEVMPFGSKSSGATFQRMTENLLANKNSVKCYMHDIIVHSPPMEKHIIHLEKVMSLLRENGLCVRLSKFFLMQPRVQLLSHVIDRYGVHTDEDKF